MIVKQLERQIYERITGKIQKIYGEGERVKDKEGVEINIKIMYSREIDIIMKRWQRELESKGRCSTVAINTYCRKGSQTSKITKEDKQKDKRGQERQVIYRQRQAERES